jgi:hypothetical protein
MARGDVVGNVVQLSASSNEDIRPADGTEWVIKAFAGDINGYIYFRATDGSNTANFFEGSAAQTGQSHGGQVTIPINYTNYLQIRNNNAGGVGNTAWFGIVSKQG